jgi:hypothetical protein
METMRLKAENTMDREMNNGRAENYSLYGIHIPDTNEDCRNLVTRNHLHHQAQQTEQAGCFRSRIPAHEPIKGDAG